MKNPRGQTQSASKEFSASLVFADDAAVHRKFKQQFPAELDAFVNSVSAAHLALENAKTTWPRSKHAQTVNLYLHAALNALFVSVHHQVSGYRLSAGHQIRMHFESIAMSLLMLLEPEWARFHSDATKYPAHDAIARVARRKSMAALKPLVNIDPEYWRLLSKVARFYNEHSHAGAFSVFHAIKFEWPGKALLGGEYDAARKDAYRAEIQLCEAAARHLGNAVPLFHRAAKAVAP
jgi:hypothetical protein